jgi:hypothetical protein
MLGRLLPGAAEGVSAKTRLTTNGRSRRSDPESKNNSMNGCLFKMSASTERLIEIPMYGNAKGTRA